MENSLTPHTVLDGLFWPVSLHLPSIFTTRCKGIGIS